MVDVVVLVVWGVGLVLMLSLLLDLFVLVKVCCGFGYLVDWVVVLFDVWDDVVDFVVCCLVRFFRGFLDFGDLGGFWDWGFVVVMGLA